MTAVLSLDLGKTGCRALLTEGSAGHRYERSGPGAPGLAEDNGLAQATQAITLVARELLHPVRIEGPLLIGVGAAGALAALDTAARLAECLLETLSAAEVAVTSDAITSHVGALGGQFGVVLAIGTGAVAIGVSQNPAFVQVDGWGPWLGDHGSGAWIGRAGLSAALAAEDGRHGPTTLQEAATARFGDLHRLPATMGTEHAARTAASFAPDVAACAEHGDDAAAAIIADAARALADTAIAAARRAGHTTAAPLPLATVGGLVHLGPVLLDPLTRHLDEAGLTPEPALGSALDGARVLATDRHTGCERLVARAGAA